MYVTLNVCHSIKEFDIHFLLVLKFIYLQLYARNIKETKYIKEMYFRV